nr:unnamed protein product [Callosobruchus analis]
MIEALLRNIFQSYVQPSSEVASIYRPPNVPVNSSDYINVFSKLDKTCIIGGDFNGHHYLWGSTDNNPPGLTLVDAIDDFPHLIFRNEGQPTRLTRPSANISAVDVTIISTDLVDISNWTVMSDTYGSDHFPILMNINSTTTNIDSHSTYKWRIHPHPDWNRFADMVNPSLIWKRAKSIRKGISHQNSKTMSAEEAEVMLKKLAPDWATLPVSSTEPYYNHFLLEAITVAEFDACIKNHDTAPGIDGITYSMIGNLPRRAKELLCVAFNKIVQTDSRSVLEALNSKHLYTHEVIKEILAKMYRLQQRQISVTLLWVKGHSGITGNLQADALAKNAIASDNIIDGIYIQDIIPSLRNQMRTAWERYYQEFAASHACHYTLATPQLPQHTGVVFQILQKKSTDITYSKTRINSLINQLKEYRSNEIYFNSLYSSFIDDTDAVSSTEEEAADNPQRKKRKTYFNFESKRLHYKQIFAQIFDTIIVQLETRFADLSVLQFFDLVNCDNFSTFSKEFPKSLLDILIEQYPIFDHISLKNELSVLYSGKDLLGGAKCAKDMLLFIFNNNLKSCLPELYKLFSLVLSIPVTSASVERSFSALKPIKTYNRSKMTQDRLSGLSIIAIEKNVVSELKETDNFYDNVLQRIFSGCFSL